MLASGLGELAAQAVVDVGELVVVGRRQAQREVVGGDRATTDIDGSTVIELSHEPTTELDRAETTFENAAERSFDELLEAALQATWSHGQNDTGILRRPEPRLPSPPRTAVRPLR
jgi:hypothetical protein